MAIREWYRTLRWRLRIGILFLRAIVYRRRLSGVEFIGITGSAAKTTTKDLVYSILSAAHPVIIGLGNPSPRYHHTPHHIGYQVIERLGDAGHRGVKSVISELGTDTIRRIRIGVRRRGDSGRAGDRVLSVLSNDDRRQLQPAIDQAVIMIQETLPILSE